MSLLDGCATTAEVFADAIAVIASKTPAVTSRKPTEDNALALPRDIPLWLRIIADELPALDTGWNLPNDNTLVLAISTKENQADAMYLRADAILSSILGNKMQQEVAYHDDANWEKFKAIGNALKAGTTAAECFTIAALPSHDTWAIGIAMKKSCLLYTSPSPRDS